MKQAMKIKITGVSGYLGSIIKNELQRKGHQVTAIDRKMLYGPPENLAKTIEGTDAIINLAGAPVLQRWTKKNKQKIYGSRIVTSQNLVKAIQILFQEQRPKKLISASAIGIYTSGKTHSEESKDYDTGFLGEVVKDWEAVWKGLPDEIVSTVFRIAVVLGKESAVIQKLLLPFRMGIGGKIGNGRQPFPFVHETDVARAFVWALENKNGGGTFNLAAPEQITNAGFTHALSKKLKRPAFIPVPKFGLQLLYGRAAVMLTESPAVVPHLLMEAGFSFKFEQIEDALEEILT
jgi:hypothetical protein